MGKGYQAVERLIAVSGEEEAGASVPKMSVGEIMLRVGNVVDAGITVREAAILMDRLDTGYLLVKSEDKLVGIFTERDAVRRVLATGLDHSRTKVADVMSFPVIGVSPETSVEDAVVLMAMHGFRRLPVVSKEGKLEGVVTITEAARALASMQKTIEELFHQLLHVVKTDEETKKPMYG